MKIDQLKTCLCIGNRDAVGTGFGAGWRVLADFNANGDNPWQSGRVHTALTAAVNT